MKKKKRYTKFSVSLQATENGLYWNGMGLRDKSYRRWGEIIKEKQKQQLNINLETELFVAVKNAVANDSV